MPRRRHHNKPYRVAPGRKADEIDDRIYELNQIMTGVWPRNAAYICSECHSAKSLSEFKMERRFGDPDRRRCLECASRALPTAKPMPKPTPKRPNRAAELAAARLRYQEEQDRIRQQQEEDEHFEHFMRMLEEEEKKYAAEMALVYDELEKGSEEPSPD